MKLLRYRQQPKLYSFKNIIILVKYLVIRYNKNNRERKSTLTSLFTSSVAVTAPLRPAVVSANDDAEAKADAVAEAEAEAEEDIVSEDDDDVDVAFSVRFFFFAFGGSVRLSWRRVERRPAAAIEERVVATYDALSCAGSNAAATSNQSTETFRFRKDRDLQAK